MAEEGMNRVVLLGRLGADPELRMTGGNMGVLNLRMATTESYLDANKERKERTEWHSITVWGKRGEGLNKILSKGSRLCVEGRLETRSFEDKQGVKQYRTGVVATNVILLDSKGSDGGQRMQSQRSGGSTPDIGSDAGADSGDDLPF